MSNVAENRKIKADRIYRTLGKMSWQRVVLGVILLIFILFLSGVASEFFFKKGNYSFAEKSMISEKWMENNKPDTKALIDAGFLFSNGDADGAYELVCTIKPENFYRLNARNYASFCSTLSDYYRTSDPQRADELNMFSGSALSFADRPRTGLFKSAED